MGLAWLGLAIMPTFRSRITCKEEEEVSSITRVLLETDRSQTALLGLVFGFWVCPFCVLFSTPYYRSRSTTTNKRPRSPLIPGVQSPLLWDY